MSNENKIRILYVQPGKYPEERFAANELHPLQQLVGGYMQAVYPWSKDKVELVCNDSGKVDGLPLNKQNLTAIRQKIGFVLQDSDNQMFMPTVYEDMIFGPRNYGLSKEETERRVDAVLSRLGLTELKHRYNHKISGGEKRMAAIATILAMEPETILMDEPSTALDPVNRRTIIHTINTLPQTKLIASHDLDMILDTCQRVILLSHGKIAADGDAKTILRDKALLEANRMELPFCLQSWPGD